MQCPECGSPLPSEDQFCRNCGWSESVKTSGTYVGRWLVITAVFLALLALFIYLGLPQIYHRAVLPGKQKATLADIRSFGVAVECYGVDYGFFPTAASTRDLVPILQPTYIRILAMRDAWGNPLRYHAWREDPESPGPDSYVIASPGKDGRWEQLDLRNYTEGPVASYDNDLVFNSGRFVVWPEGASY